MAKVSIPGSLGLQAGLRLSLGISWHGNLFRVATVYDTVIRVARQTAPEGPLLMNKNDWKYVVDTLMFISLLGIVVVGLLLAFVIPRGSAPDGAKVLLGLHRHDWGNIHLYLSLAFTAFVTVHILLNWEWVKCMAKKKFKKGLGGRPGPDRRPFVRPPRRPLGPSAGVSGSGDGKAGRGRQGRAAGTGPGHGAGGTR